MLLYTIIVLVLLYDRLVGWLVCLRTVMRCKKTREIENISYGFMAYSSGFRITSEPTSVLPVATVAGTAYIPDIPVLPVFYNYMLVLLYSSTIYYIIYSIYGSASTTISNRLV